MSGRLWVGGWGSRIKPNNLHIKLTFLSLSYWAFHFFSIIPLTTRGNKQPQWKKNKKQYKIRKSLNEHRQQANQTNILSDTRKFRGAGVIKTGKTRKTNLPYRMFPSNWPSWASAVAWLRYAVCTRGSESLMGAGDSISLFTHSSWAYFSSPAPRLKLRWTSLASSMLTLVERTGSK